MKLLLVCILAMLSLVAYAAPRTAEEALDSLHGTVLKQLIDGNKRYVETKMNTCNESTGQLRSELAKGQKPIAIILSCSDSRVPPEIIFDKTLGELFVVRVAGNVVDPIILGSIEYAVEHLKTAVIVVLGHEKCGAVTAACKAKPRAKAVENKDRREETHAVEHVDREVDNIGAILSQIMPAVATVKRTSNKSDAEFIEDVIDENIRLAVSNLQKKSKIVAQEVKIGKVKIFQAKYDLDDGKVTFFDNNTGTDSHDVAKTIAPAIAMNEDKKVDKKDDKKDDKKEEKKEEVKPASKGKSTDQVF